METTITQKVTLVIEECYKCGVAFAFPKSMQEQRRKDGYTFYCPSGHGQCYGESESIRLKHQLDQCDADRERMKRDLNVALDNLTAEKRKAKLLLKRIHAGVCPDCHRHFTNLERHMNTKHIHKEE